MTSANGDASSPSGPAPLTVGSLLGQPQGRPAADAGFASAGSTTQAGAEPAVGVQEGTDWRVEEGAIRTGAGPAGFTVGGVERLTYNNPYNQSIERVWFDGKLVFACDVGEVDVDPAVVKVAQEYQIVYRVELDEGGKLRHAPEMVPGQYNIYDSVPGMAKYSPIWQFNYVVVPRDYRAQSLRSEADSRAAIRSCTATSLRTDRSSKGRRARPRLRFLRTQRRHSRISHM
jgi:hypothetical protein